MVVIGLTKMALLLFYWMVFPTKPFRNVLTGAIIICALYIPVFSLMIVFNCLPISYTWTKWTGETQGSCINLNAFAWAHAIINIVFDLFIMFLPIPQLLHLHLGRRKKIHLVLMFSVGLL